MPESKRVFAPKAGKRVQISSDPENALLSIFFWPED